MTNELLESDEPRAFELVSGDGASPFVIACDHASRRIPRRLGDLGVARAELETHIAWDIGVADLARRMAALLGAELALANYSRLVIDCNRPLSVPDSIVRASGGVSIPGNQDLSPLEVERRRDAVFRPYHGAISAMLDRRLRAGQDTIYIALHSFTPVLLGNARPWHVGVLYQRDPRLAHPLLRLLRSQPELVVGDNEPYRVTDSSDYSLISYGELRGLRHVEIEVRQDLLVDTTQQWHWAEQLSGYLTEVCGNQG